jgi:putative membrane protein
MFYHYVLAIHIIFVVCWFAGLFYIVRLFIYHTEAQDKPDPEKKILSDQFVIMERRLWNVITVPSMILTIAAGITMLFLAPGWLQQTWLHIKLTFVILLLIYHFMCQNKIKQMRNGLFIWSSARWRIWNEIATIFLFAIVFLAVVKDGLSWIYGTVGIIVFSMIIMSAVKIYKYFRTKNEKGSKEELNAKINQIKRDIKELVKPYCTEGYSIDCYGAYEIDPKNLVYLVCVQSDRMKEQLKANVELNNALRNTLITNEYPVEARGNVYIDFESQETVDRESNGDWHLHLQ